MSEMIIVLGLLGILTTGAILILNPGQQLKKARDAERKSDLKLMQAALELYRTNEGEYPPDTTVPHSLANCSGSLIGLEDGACPTDALSTTVYIQSVAKDPKTGLDYYYLKDTPTNGYTIYSCLENINDTEQLSVGNEPSSAIKTALGCNSSAYKYYKVQNL